MRQIKYKARLAAATHNARPMSRLPLPSLLPSLLPLTLREWRHHPWRHAVALLAVALGVALASSVHIINESALAEFSAAVRSANGEPDLSLRGQRAGFDDALFDTVAVDEAVQAASPVLEIDTFARSPQGVRVPLRVVVSDRGLKAGTAELQGRRDETATAVALASLTAAVRERLAA